MEMLILNYICKIQKSSQKEPSKPSTHIFSRLASFSIAPIVQIPYLYR